MGDGVIGWVHIFDGPASAPPDLLHEAWPAPGDSALPVTALLAEVPISGEVQNHDLVRQLEPHRRAQFLHDRTAPVLTGPR
ncbi:hypothetical protein [Ilumatobacter sp.]|uniref:hypothetical protein n=1 Tax=Ilumatobacter sp. TaxID=1967498 RepID=UPI003752DA46